MGEKMYFPSLSCKFKIVYHLMDKGDISAFFV